MGDIVNDPHAVGFDNEFFDFAGEPHTWFAIYSSPALHMNGLVVPSPGMPGRTHFGAVALLVHKTRILVEMRDEGLAVSLDGRAFIGSVAFESGNRNSLNKPYLARLRVERTRMRLMTGEITARIYRDIHGLPDLFTDEHLDIYLRVGVLGTLSNGVYPHGVLGQTADADFAPRLPVPGGMQGEGVIEGTHLDYRVSGSFETDTKFSRFGMAPQFPPQFGVRTEREGVAETW
jgi:hypothetical protein